MEDEAIELMATYYSLDTIVEREKIDPQIVIRFLIEEEDLDIGNYLTNYADD